MLAISFGKSTSPRYNNAVKLADKFSLIEKSEKVFTVTLPVKEVFEKWESFNTLFWMVVDWKETVLSYEGMNYQSHTDKTRIFYALQNAHWKWMNYVEERISKVYNTTREELDISNLDTQNIDDATADLLIDLYTFNKE
nr:MAG TPA: hypothetical protein [Caudoviricetes sp.]